MELCGEKLFHIDPESEGYYEVLDLGIGKLYGGSLNAKGNLSLAGHDDEGKFKKLEELDKNDTFVIVDKNLKETTYKITEITTVEPDDLEPLRSDDSKTEITLITCQNGTTSRLIVKAEKTNSDDTPSIMLRANDNTMFIIQYCEENIVCKTMEFTHRNVKSHFSFSPSSFRILSLAIHLARFISAAF